ncbi:predicted protein [Naegleria gruberi]|uniref:Predicted protein n=1 Tax=Naegleria gruberi TaxID=5762 RepID=D2VJU5_NAEGR|nr:uncharacterized protein NAEGRDRAFT_69164 [Naegleria gruberi]EFC42833.1 predicted protein [Naegleria gruberi]|eukprot:XP_002675577.1 predicted protein [Naegleria gruberi strain NEG-M]
MSSTTNNNGLNNTVRTLQSIISNNTNNDPFHSTPSNNLYNNNEQAVGWGSSNVQSSPSRNQAPIGSEIKRNTTPNNNEYFGLSIQRAISAPPAMELDTNNIFATQSRYSHLFGDIRCESDYANFYNSYSNKDSLPTPIEANPLFLSPYEMFGKPKGNMYGPPNGMNMGVSSSTAPNMYPYQQMMPNNYQNAYGMENAWAMQQQQGFPPGMDNQNMMQQHMQQHYPPQAQQQLPTLEQQRLYLQNKQLEEALSRQQQQLEFYGQQIMQQQQQLIQQHNPTTGFIQKPTPMPTGGNFNQVIPPNHLPVSPQKQEVASPPIAFNTIVASNMGVPVNNTSAKTIVASNNVVEQANSGSSSPTSDSSSGASTPTISNKKKEGKKKKEKVDTSDDDEKSSKKSAFGKLSSMTDAVGKVYKLAKDQYGCRFLQKKITDGEQGLQMVFDEIYDHIVELMTDPFGNYLCQKLVEHCTNEHKTLIIRAVSKDLINISMNMHGTRAVQKLIECLTTQDQIGEIIEALKDSVVPLIKDLNGNHVIQRCLQQLIPENKQFIYNAVAGRCVEVATHKHGCCVLQRCIDHAAESQRMMLIKEVIANAHTLIQNPFGNYVVQYVLDLGDDSINEKIIARFYGSIASLSINKFSSNVIEKCLRIGNENVKNTMIEEVLEDRNLSALLQDSFGNYVVQTAISISDANQFARFNNNVKPYLPIIKNAPYYKKLESKLNRVPKPATSSPSPKQSSKK